MWLSSERRGAHVTITVAEMTADHMTPDEWRRVKTITAEALERPASERLAFVTAECGSDDRLRDEVWSLLVASDKAAMLYEAPVFQLGNVQAPGH
jgi:hypothetical protein